MASQRIEVKAPKTSSAHDHVRRRRSSALSCGIKPRNPKLGDFFRTNTELYDQLGRELKTAIEETRPPPSHPASPPARARGVPSLLDILQRRVGNIDEAASRGWSFTDDDESPASAVEDDSHGNSDDASVGMPASPATATTSPSVHVADPKFVSQLDGADPDLTNSSPPKKALNVLHELQQAPPHYTSYRLVFRRKRTLSLHHELQRLHRIKLASLAQTKRTSSAATQLTLPWDANGNYVSGSAPHVPNSLRTQSSIEPMYSVPKQIQLDVVTTWLDQAISDDDISRFQHAASNQPIHVFVDMSNIVIGFCKDKPTSSHTPKSLPLRIH